MEECYFHKENGRPGFFSIGANAEDAVSSGLTVGNVIDDDLSLPGVELPATVANPILPFNYPIPGGLVEDKLIKLTGIVPDKSPGFNVDFHSGDPQSEVAMQIRFMFAYGFLSSDKKVLIRSQTGGGWGQDEPGDASSMAPGQVFNIAIAVSVKEGFAITNDSAVIAQYAHRHPPQHVNSIHLDGGVIITRLSFEGGTNFVPAGIPEDYGIPREYNIPIPYISIIEGSIYPGRSIKISGVPKLAATEFRINLQASDKEEKVALHINPRLKANEVVLNSKDRTWGWRFEERPKGCPFMQNHHFDIEIVVDLKEYRILVNGHPYARFTHRHEKFQNISTLYIDGDVCIADVVIT